MAAFLTDPKFIVAIITLASQAIGMLGFHADPVQLTAALSPLYLYILAHAHAASGNTIPAPTVLAATATPTIAKAATIATLFAVLCFMGCAGTRSQKATEAKAAVCTANDVQQIVTIFEGAGNGYQKLLDAVAKVGPDVWTCVGKQAVPPPATNPPSR